MCSHISGVKMSEKRYKGYIVRKNDYSESLRNASLRSRVNCDDCLCSCSKLFPNANVGEVYGQKLSNSKESDVFYNHTSCGKSAYYRGIGQKVNLSNWLL